MKLYQSNGKDSKRIWNIGQSYRRVDIWYSSLHLYLNLNFLEFGADLSSWNFLGAYRLAGAALIAPVINYWWSGFPRNLSAEAYYLQLPQDQWALRVAHYAPWLIYWWNTQKLFPASAVVARNPQIFSTQDKQLISKLSGKQTYKVLFNLPSIHS